MERKWRIVSSKTLLKDRWIDLRADHCVTPGGKEISPYYVLAYSDWAHIVALTPDDGIVLTRQYRHAAGEFLYELPSGSVDADDDDPEMTARRELEEETGYVAERWLKAGALSPNPATHTNKAHIFVALDAQLKGTQKLDAGEEGLTVHVFPLAEVLNSLGAGLLGQSMHVASLVLALTAIGRLKLTL